MKPRTLFVAAGLFAGLAPILRADQEPAGEAASEPQEPQAAPRLVIKGFGDIDYRYTGGDGEDTPNTFSLGQLDIFMTSELSDSLSVLAEVVVESEENEEAIVDVERYQIKYSASDWLNVVLGRMHTALGHWNQTYHHGTWFQTTALRPEVYRFEDEGGVLPIHEVGLQVLGTRPVGGVLLEYNLSLTNGRGRNREEIVVTQDHNASKALNLWLGLKPSALPGLRFGGVVRFDQIPEDLQGSGRAELSEVILGGFATYERAGVEALFELIRVEHEDEAAAVRYDTTGYYVQAAYGLGRFKPYYRFDSLEVADGDPFYRQDTTDIRKHTVGLRVDPWTWAALKAELSFEDPDPGEKVNGVALQAAFTF
ncbi:MAG TPA: hypothetical protein VFM88_03670 [Vicinamibacteria bacterium]|nr:hypothetical protein [Vicinamibacteria bacterium]